MFEFEIMLTGYTLIVATTSVIISKVFSRKQLMQIHKKLSKLEIEFEKTNLDIKNLHSILKEQNLQH